KADAGTLSIGTTALPLQEAKPLPASDCHYEPMTPRSLPVRYAAGLSLAYLLSAAEVVAIVISVSRETVLEAQSVLNVTNLIATAAIIVVGTLSVGLSGVALVARAL